MKKWWLLGAGIVLVGGSIAAYYVWDKEEVTVAAAVNTTKVFKGSIEVAVAGSGSISLANRETFKAGKSGTVSEVLVQEGDMVKAGDVLVVLEGEDNADQIKSQQVSLEKKLMDLTTMQDNYKAATTEEEQKKIDLQMKQQKMDIELARSSIAELQEKSASSTITAPIGGTMATLNVAVDDELNNTSDVGEIVDYDNMELVVSVDELDIPQVEIGQTATIAVEALSDETFTGKVTEIAKEGTASNGVASFDVTVTVDKGASTTLKAGMSAEASITIDKKDDALLLPIDAVQSMGDRYMVILPTAEQSAAIAENEANRPQWNGQGQGGQTGTAQGTATEGGQAGTAQGTSTEGGQAGGTQGTTPEGGQAGGTQGTAPEGGQAGGAQGTAPEGGQAGGAQGTASEGDQADAAEGTSQAGGNRQGGAGGGRANMQFIEVGLHNEDYIEIVSGLSEGDSVVVPTVVSSSSSSEQQMQGGMGMGGLMGGMTGGFPSGGGGGGFQGGGGGGQRPTGGGGGGQ
ncbi:HlyD family secretion protein [Paenibacillus phyllosphaerae]|uniref:HlyD family secretion protein n=1 Tax=Paenibacillus phyllosphaerae TaxID=274593 RepID=A0A7W5B268_9BACL|nr:efflux RND transporter periplasmic adaptor subunit [Paenibacillus phyllosphaerae]MBB3112973.1 HlyD family secretion protein [Paenibacillus phyllosphaerae]